MTRRPHECLPDGPTIILDELPPRSWQDTVVPEFSDDCDKVGFYAEWLAKHLMQTTVPVHPWQNELIDQPGMLRQNCCQDGLRNTLYDCEVALEIVEASHAAGETWEAFRDRQYKCFCSQEKTDPNWQGWGFEGEWLCCSSTWKRVGEEWREKIAIPNLPDFPDIPFRVYLLQEIQAQPEMLPEQIVWEFLMGFEFSLNPKTR